MASNYNKIFYYTEESNILTIKKVKYLKNKKIIEISRFKIPTKGDKIFNLNKVWPKIEKTKSYKKIYKRKNKQKNTKPKINKKKQKKFLLQLFKIWNKKENIV